MPEKPRVKAPKQRAGAPQGTSTGSRLAVLGAALGALVAVGAVAAFVGLGGGGGGVDEAAVRTALRAAGCTLQDVPAKPGAHSVQDPGGTAPSWNTDPPTNGAHYAVAAIFGIYEEPLELARVVHNLEHGGIFVFYGEDVPRATVNELRGFYSDHQTGTIMAPLPRLGDQFALGAWVAEGEIEKGYLAKCRTFDEAALSTFFRELQFKGPERFDPSDLQPGR
ncbi:MAG TPA: DUF3105 domain-containing protein [Gaiellaceae bacterium]|nr:DUF3105 domain-containing protein [Gaiellaceae bacterium]